MATGPWHYREAEALAESSLRWITGWGHEDMTPDGRLARKNSDLAKAQVHAGLAIAAAIVDGATMRPEDRDEWDRATGRPEATP